MINDVLKVGLAQIAPVWLNKEKTTEKIVSYISEAGEHNCDLVVFGEALLPGYPFWVELTDGAKFNSSVQKEIYAHYLSQGIDPYSTDLDQVRSIAAEKRISVVLGTIEKAANRGGHSLYCSLVYIDKGGVVQSVHRKLMPTYDERLVWSPGDGHGLRVHKLGAFTVGGLNCWENWMPLSRTALYGMGEDLHVAIWPGSKRNTEDITRFIAKESRSYVISVSGLMRKTDIQTDIPYSDMISSNCPDMPADGGSCIAAPDGEWVVEPQVGQEVLKVAEIDHKQVRMERHNFDPAGHYSRPDVTKLYVNRDRQQIIQIDDENNKL
ncbi:MAG: carbon-nitrogen hydrolase family protein [Cyclobacteriaceae bacterium]|jgi:nitrilase